MSKQSEREEFLVVMAREGIPLHAGRLLLRHAATLNRLAELECSSEAADRDRVPCPGSWGGPCLCEHWHSQDGERGCGCGPENDGHHPVTRIAVRGASVERRVSVICEPFGIKPNFAGDPRGCVLRLTMPSGRDAGWGGVGVPA